LLSLGLALLICGLCCLGHRGTLTDRIGPRLVVVTGLVLTALGTWPSPRLVRPPVDLSLGATVLAAILAHELLNCAVVTAAARGQAYNTAFWWVGIGSA